MFENIIGNDNIKEQLKKMLQNQSSLHSYLFLGIQGIGKKLIAKEFAKRLLCLEKDYMQNCKSCVEFESENHPDFMCIEPDGNSIKIEQIRYLQKKIQEKPIISNKKVYIINNADLMTTEAQNCLLKTLEEPPEFATIILIGSNENAFLATIKSRCIIFHFNPIENGKIKQYMFEKYGISDLSENRLNTFQGSLKKAIELKDKKEQYEKIDNLIKDLERKDLIEIIKQSEILYQSKEEIFDLLEYTNILLFEKAKDNYLYTNCIQIVENTKKRLKQNGNYDMCIDNMVFNIWEAVN